MAEIDFTSTKKYFLFLIDFSVESLASLKYLVKFVKTVNGEIELLYSFEKQNFTDESNAQAVLFDIKEQERKIVRKLISLKEIIEVENIPVKTSYTFGNLELEVNLKREALKENLVVVIDAESKGKIKDSTKFLINSYSGSVLIINSSSDFENGNSIVLSGDSDSLNKSDLNIPSELCNQLNSPLIVLESVRRNESRGFTYNNDKKLDVFYNPISESKTLLDLKKYVTNNSIKLLGICRENTSKSLLKKFFNTNKSVFEIVKNINTPIIILSNN